jgi:hypothetical protein
MDGENNVRVINKEYERIQSNPDNLIMSKELQDSIDPFTAESEATKAAMSLTLEDTSGLPFTVMGDLVEFSCRDSNTSLYHLCIETSRIAPEFLSALDSVSKAGKKAKLYASGLYKIVTNPFIDSWGMTTEDHKRMRLKLNFRSSVVEFS